MAIIIPRNYTNDVLLLEQELDDAFNSIEAYIRTTPFQSSNIQPNSLTSTRIIPASITSAKLADEAATTDKFFPKSVTLEKLDTGVAEQLVPPGILTMFSGSTAPSSWLLCDGAAVSRTTYDKLFAVIGVTHGSGDGVTTFNLPDMRGRFIRGVDQGTGRDPDASSRTASNTGGNTGDASGTLQGSTFKSHNHQLTAHFPGPSSVIPAGAQGTFNNSISASQVRAFGGAETRPKNVSKIFVIKT